MTKEGYIIQECENKNLKYKIFDSEVFIYTGVAEWHFDLYAEYNIRLFHCNYYYSSRSGKFGNSYHVQKRKFSNCGDIINYIYEHDKNFMKRKPQPTRMEQIYARISCC